MKKSELAVITHTKNLLEYIFQVTQKSKLIYRYTYVSRMQNLIMEVVELLYLANDTDLYDNLRFDYQKRAKTKLRLLDTISEASTKFNCITFKQFNHISKEIYSVIALLDGWVNSDLKRKGNMV